MHFIIQCIGICSKKIFTQNDGNATKQISVDRILLKQPIYV